MYLIKRCVHKMYNNLDVFVPMAFFVRFSEDLIPRHPCLDLVWCCEQPLQRQVGRRLVVMVKKEHWTSELEGQGRSSREHDDFRKKYFTHFSDSLPHTVPQLTK